MTDQVNFRERAFLVGETIKDLTAKREGFQPAKAGEYFLSYDEVSTNTRPLTVNDVEEVIGQPFTLKQFLPHGWTVAPWHEGRIRVLLHRKH